MFGHFRSDVGDAKKPMLNYNTTSVDVPIASVQKPSPTSGDDVTKGENTQTAQDGTNSNKYARKKCGLKPIRPTGFSASSLNPTTPGRLSGLNPTTPGRLSSLNPVTPGRMTHTPRMNFKENEPSRFMPQDFPTTPKFSRSESTPELHRFKKMDSLLMSTDRSTTTDKTHSHPLQDSSVSNLLTLTSDSLPDIFRKPIAQRQPELLTGQANKSDEKATSKWGYGPSSSLPASTFKYATNEVVNLKPVREETPVAALSTFVTPVVGAAPANSVKGEGYSWARPSDKSLTIQQCEPASEPPESLFSRSLDKSNLTSSDTASALGLSQPTVRAQSSTIVHQPANAWHQPPVSTVRALDPQFAAASSLSVSTAQTSIQAAPSLSMPKDLSPKEGTPITFESFGTQKPLLSKEPAKPTVPSAPVVAPRPHEAPPAPVPMHTAIGVQPAPVPSQGDAPPKVPQSSSVGSNQLPPPNRPPPKTKQILVNGKAYTVMKPLGRGGSSVVYQVLNPEFTDVLALKVVRLDSVDEVTAEGYINEVRLLKQLQGLPRVVRLLEFEYNEDEEKLLLVMEKGDTDFATVIRNRTTMNAINPTLVRFYWQEMLEAVGEIHNKNVIHTDLKPANFLLVNGGLKLIDFGIATSIQADMTSIMKDSQCGTYNYMAPEAIKSAAPAGANQEYKISRKTDVWSLGCMLYSLIYKNPPFTKFRDTIEKINAIVDERHVIDFPPTADPLVISVLKSCLDRNPRNRPTIEQLLAHPYLIGGTVSMPTTLNSDGLQSALAPFMYGGKLSAEAKEWIQPMM